MHTLNRTMENDTCIHSIEQWRTIHAYKAIFFVGNLKRSTTADQLTTYIQQRVATTTDRTLDGLSASILQSSAGEPARKSSAAHVTMYARDGWLLRSRNFWPGRLYCRKWRFRDTDDSPPAGTDDSSHDTDDSSPAGTDDSSPSGTGERNQAVSDTNELFQPEIEVGNTLAAAKDSTANQLDSLPSLKPRGKARSHESTISPSTLIPRKWTHEPACPTILPATEAAHPGTIVQITANKCIWPAE